MKKLITLLLLFNTACAASFSWVTNTNGNWSNPSNWLPNGAPGANDDVIIMSSATLTVDMIIKCKSITIVSAATIICNYQLTTGNLTIDQNLTFSGPQMAVINGAATFGYNCSLTVNNKVNFNGGGIVMGGDSAGTITNNGTILVTGNFTYGYQSQLINNGMLHFINAQINGPVGSFIVKNSATASLTVTGGTVDVQTQ